MIIRELITFDEKRLRVAKYASSSTVNSTFETYIVNKLNDFDVRDFKSEDEMRIAVSPNIPSRYKDYSRSNLHKEDEKLYDSKHNLQ